MLIIWCFALLQLLCVLSSHKFLENVQARDFLMQKLYALRRPKTNIQILQQNVLLKYKSVRIYFYGVSVVDAGVWSKLVIFLANTSKTSSFVYLFKTVLCSSRQHQVQSAGSNLFHVWMQPWGTRYVATFLRTHGQEVFPEIRAAYVDTMNKVELLYSCSRHLVYCGQSGAGAGSSWE